MAEADWKYLQYNVENGQKRTSDGPSGGPSSLADLDDTSISNPSNGQMLGYDGTEGKWKNVAAPAGSVTDVQVDGQSVVDQQGVAEISLPSVPVQDVQVDGTSVVNQQGIAEIQIPTPPTPDYPVADVKVNGTSVVSNKQALITSYKEVTQAQYESLPDTKLSDGILYAIKDGGQAVDGFPPLIYSDEEREVGVWKDGKPLYQKTVILSATDIKDGSYQKYCDIPIGNIDTVAFIDCTLLTTTDAPFHLPYVNSATISIGYFIDEATSTYLRIQLRYGNDIGSNYWGGMLVNIQYTKTTDTPGSGTWNQQGAIAHHYSTEEKVIGTWIDGKPLYEKTFTKTLANAPDADSASFLVASNVTGIETLVKMDGTIKAISAYAFAPVCGLPVQVGWNYAFHINPTNQLVVWTSNAYANYSQIAGGTAVCILQYTKTTD